MPDAILSRLELAWQDTAQSHVISQSLYDFDLDSGLLRIQDRDFIFVARASEGGLSLPAGSHVIKQIRSTAQEIGYALVRLAPEFARESLMLGTQVDQAILRHERSKKPDVVNFMVNVSAAHRFQAGERYRLDLNYVVPLESVGPFLLFSGAIQPSDYEIVKQLGANSASKSVLLLVRRALPFTAYVFEPASLNYFPTPSRSHFDNKTQDHRVRHNMTVSLADYRRAHYFTVAADLA